MKIRELYLKNFRGFKEQQIKFSENFTVIAGINGNGKTAILEALALLISRLLPQISPARLGYRYFQVSDIHGNEAATALEMNANCAGFPVRFSGSFERLVPYQAFPKLAPRLKDAIRNAYGLDKTRSTDAAPIAVYYTTDRAGFSLPRRLDGNVPIGQAAAYHRALVKKKVDYKDFMRWYRVVLKLNERPPGHPTAPQRMIETIEFVLHEFLNQIDSIRVEDNPPRLLVNKGRQTLDLAQLSDGERSFLAMVIDLCKRLARANPGIKTLDGEGVVLIDELELHLHPTWQRGSVDKLRRIFPKIQFIATTHSPFVIQSLRPGELVNLEPGEFEIAQLAQHAKAALPEIAEVPMTAEVQPVEYSNQSVEDIAEGVMGVEMPQKSQRYQQMMKSAEEYFKLVRLPENQHGDIENVKRRLDELSAPFSDDPAYQALLRIEREINLEGGQNAPA
jgi:predicted ATP-binding protein involved in virulence